MRVQLGDYQYYGNTWYLSYNRETGQVRCTMTHPDDEADDDINGILSSIEAATRYSQHTPLDPLCEAVIRLEHTTLT